MPAGRSEQMVTIFALLLVSAMRQTPAAAILPMRDEAASCRPIAARGQDLDRLLHSGMFEIRYTVVGKNAINNQDDVNRNGVPDDIDDLSRQLDAAYDYYVDVLGLTPPLSQPRYRRADRIEVLVEKIPQRTGVSFDEAVREAGQSNCELMIVVSAHLEFRRNPTAAHELFHLFQYGYAMFKVPWYLEGMARWIEAIFTSETNMSPHRSSTPLRCEDVLDQSYRASLFWRSAAQFASPRRNASLPRRFRDNHYVNGRPVIADGSFSGGIIRPVLEHLQRASLQVSRDGLSDFDWPEDVQKSHRFDFLMCRSVESGLAAAR